ncbi:MAG: FkbM family methyltransferase [Pseudomonadota bacterium]
MTWPEGTAKAIARSLDIYYRDAARTARMDRLNAEFVRPGCLAFDIGAHLGDRTASYRRLGASVVAVEPQSAVMRALRLIHGRDRQVRLVNATVGAVEGETILFVNTTNPTVSTASRDLVNAAPHAAAWRDQIWDREIRTRMTTLDRLIAEHGVPDFVKVDVEGHEADVLKGLSEPIRTLVFEFTTLQRSVAITALERLQSLGRYRFNYSLGESHRLVFERWARAEDMAGVIENLPEDANSGDIYAQADVIGV